jgi:vacuolar protein sorting-associated protein 13A/C
MSSILRSKIIDILNASVGQYCHGIDKDHISVSVFNGEVRISDLAIKQDCFIHHGFPFSVSAGRVGSLVVLIPWASLSSQPIEISLTDLDLNPEVGAGNDLLSDGNRGKVGNG